MSFKTPPVPFNNKTLRVLITWCFGAIAEGSWGGPGSQFGKKGSEVRDFPT